MMGLKKKKNILIITIFMIICFILYQLYFFLTITSEDGLSDRVILIVDHRELHELKETQKHVIVRSQSDKFIDNNGVIRGIMQFQISNYRPDNNNEFTCLKTKQKIPFENVNDDYCDCEDATDEPSTNACVNGTFYCGTQHSTKPIALISIPSGQVNDGVCDCCDGSDEWLHNAKKKLLSQINFKLARQLVNECPNKCI